MLKIPMTKKSIEPLIFTPWMIGYDLVVLPMKMVVSYGFGNIMGNRNNYKYPGHGGVLWVLNGFRLSKI
jgi:hypothetical protein